MRAMPEVGCDAGNARGAPLGRRRRGGGEHTAGYFRVNTERSAAEEYRPLMTLSGDATEV